MGRRAKLFASERVPRVVAAVIATGVLLAAGCSLVTSYDGFTADGPPCGKRFPPPPTMSAGKGGPDVVGATSALQFLDDPNGGHLGYDLDNLCTCPDLAARPCKNVNAGSNAQCDVEGTGIDNASAGALTVLFSPEATARLADSLRHGRNGFLIRVEGWDGTPDDASVVVALYNVVGLNGDVDGGAGTKLDGTDEIIVDQASLLTPAADLGPKYFSTNAYVSGGNLVAPLDFDFRVENANAQGSLSVIYIPLRFAHLVGPIERVGTSGLRMKNAQLVGRLPEADIFAQFSALGVCQADPSFADVKKLLCASLDLPLQPGTGRSTTACNALSIAIGVTIGPVKMGGSVAAPAPPSRCGMEPVARCP